IADHKANDIIVGDLQSLFPSDGILSEEMPDDPGRLEHSRVWMVDPMDGTREFIAGREDFAVQIGLVIGGIPSLGVAHHPTRDKMYSAGIGLGASLEHEGRLRSLHVSPEQVAARLTLAMSRSYRSGRVDQIAEQLQIRQIVRIGSVGLKVGLICEGLAHLYIHLGSL